MCQMRLCERNDSIYKAYLLGDKIKELSERFCLSEKSIWRIVGQEKKKEIRIFIPGICYPGDFFYLNFYYINI